MHYILWYSFNLSAKYTLDKKLNLASGWANACKDWFVSVLNASLRAFHDFESEHKPVQLVLLSSSAGLFAMRLTVPMLSLYCVKAVNSPSSLMDSPLKGRQEYKLRIRALLWQSSTKFCSAWRCSVCSGYRYQKTYFLTNTGIPWLKLWVNLGHLLEQPMLDFQWRLFKY